MSHHGKWQSIHWSHMEWSALGSETQEVEILIRDIICEAVFKKWPQGFSKDTKYIFFFPNLYPAQSLFCTQWCVLVTFEAQFVKPAKIFNIFEELILKTLSSFISSQFNFKY